jgi:glycosyltransferase involved in cell wall biosynthesis
MQDKSYTGTKVCHYYAKEWKAMGYNVQVVHFITLFPKLFYLAGKLFGNIINAKTGFVVYNSVPSKPTNYIIDNIPILLMPLFKFIPHSAFGAKKVKKAIEIVRSELETKEFVPDIITGHFVLPQLQILNILKKHYPKSTSCLVLHSEGYSIPKIYPDYQTLFRSVDVWGFRSLAFKNSFESTYGKREKSFISYSGIPEKYIDSHPSKDFSQGVNRFCFLGSLYKLKRIDDTLLALKNVFGEDEFHFDIIGEGAERSRLENLTRELNIEKNVEFHGNMSRDDAQELIRKSQCFIMVSSREAFGLVYVEAMAKSCITIGTRGQGIDGVIKHGENGFLCNSYNVDELTQLIKTIRKMSEQDLVQMSKNALLTASQLTDRKVAEHYIESISKL